MKADLKFLLMCTVIVGAAYGIMYLAGPSGVVVREVRQQMPLYIPNLIIDPGTGCHYLAAPQGGLTPRMDITGQQMCTAVRER